MAPLIVLVGCAVLLWLLGRAGVAMFQDLRTVLRDALGLMFLLTASAHWGKRRADLIRMVPAAFPRAGLLVTITGVLEILGAIGLFVPRTAFAASICLILLLIVIFPAYVRAAREKLTIAGAPVPGLAARTALQVIFISALACVAWLK
jgi:uncharacterized membrane protein